MRVAQRARPAVGLPRRAWGVFRSLQAGRYPCSPAAPPRTARPVPFKNILPVLGGGLIDVLKKAFFHYFHNIFAPTPRPRPPCPNPKATRIPVPHHIPKDPYPVLKSCAVPLAFARTISKTISTISITTSFHQKSIFKQIFVPSPLRANVPKPESNTTPSAGSRPKRPLLRSQIVRDSPCFLE